MKPSRRRLLACALAAPALLTRRANAVGNVTSAIPPGAWEEAYRAIVAPALAANEGIDVAFEPLFSVDIVAKARAARGNPPFDVMPLDPGPRSSGIDFELFEPFDATKLKNASKVPASLIDKYGTGVAAQVVGIVYNPKKVAKPSGWKDLFKPEFVTHLGLTGFQTSYGTMCLIEIAKAFGGSDTDVEPAFVEIKKALPQVAAVSLPGPLPGLFQQGQIDLMFGNTQTVATLKARGVDIEFAVPDTGAMAFVTTMHVSKGAQHVREAYAYIDTVLSTPVQDKLASKPYFLVPVNKEVDPGPNVPMKSAEEVTKFINYDWTKINLQRPKWIDRFNKEVAK